MTSTPQRSFISPLMRTSIGMILLYLLGDLLYIPDGYELAIMSDCMDGTSFVNCSSIHMGFRPPLMSTCMAFDGRDSLLSIVSLACTAVLMGNAKKAMLCGLISCIIRTQTTGYL